MFYVYHIQMPRNPFFGFSSAGLSGNRIGPTFVPTGDDWDVALV